MSPELTLLKLLLKKKAYQTYYQYVDLKHLKDVYKELWYIYNVLRGMHEKTPHDLSLDEIEAAFFATYPDSQEVYPDLFKQIRSLEIGEEVGEVLLAQIKRRKDALKLSESLFKVSQGQDVPTLEEQLKEFDESKETHASSCLLSPVTTDLEQLIHSAYAEQGYRWRLGCLNKSLGSLRKGDFGFIFARPETGKTTFLASEITAFLAQGAKVVWFNNEEQGSKVMLRIFQAWFGASLEQVLSNVKRFNEEFNKQTKGNLLMYDAATISRREVEAIVAAEQPDIVVYDQLTKIKGFTADRNDLELGAKFQWARELAKNSHAAIGVSQADGSAENVRYLTMEHVANVKTAVQAEADWILGIGAIHDSGWEDVRFLNISKNKLLGDSDTLSELRHGKFETLIEPTVARYKDVAEYV